MEKEKSAGFLKVNTMNRGEEVGSHDQQFIKIHHQISLIPLLILLRAANRKVSRKSRVASRI
jgi:hypothetical protein